MPHKRIKIELVSAKQQFYYIMTSSYWCSVQLDENNLTFCEDGDPVMTCPGSRSVHLLIAKHFTNDVETVQ